MQVKRGNHEELYAMLRSGEVDLVLNDQRRAFSDEYVNLILATVGSYIEIAGRSPLAALSEITLQELKNTPCILISSEGQQDTVIGGKGFMPGSEESQTALQELLGDHLGEGSRIAAPLRGAALEKLKIGKNVIIVGNLLAMARGGITIEDDAMIAANVQLISNNHDPYDRWVLPCRPILIKKGAWIGAGATILPGVCVGRYAVVGAASVVTKDVPDYAVVVGNPARSIRTLDAARCEAQKG